MTACANFELLIHGLIDGELDAANASACEKHLEGCESCSARFDTIKRVRQQLHSTPPRYSAGAPLRAAIDTELSRQLRLSRQRFGEAAPRSLFRRTVWPIVAAAMTAGLALVLLFGPLFGVRGNLESEIVAAHLRSLQADHLLDVATSDRHTVKPWFAGKLEFSPPVVDLADRGFELAGGRIDYFQDHPAAALAYRRRAHIINLFVWPDAHSDVAPNVRMVNGFSLIYWRQGAMAYCGISDLQAEELRVFQREFVSRIGS